MMDIRTYLSQGKPLLFDGAMGTYFAAHPGRAEERCERANLTRPEEILRIHRAYLQAGCRAIKTNTFAISGDLSDGNDETACDIVNAACHLARQAAQPYGAYVFADLGPAPRDHSRAPADLYQTQAQWFLEQGVTHFLVETLSGDEGLPELAGWLKEKNPDAFLMVSFAVDHSGMTSAGRLGSELYRFASELAGVDAVGFNCVSGPRHLLKYIQTLELSDKPLTVIPNAGYPTVLGRRTVFGGQPDYFAGQIAQIVQAGASIVGGCCGTTPEHIAQTAQALKEPLPKCTVSAPKKLLKPAANASNSLWEKLEAGKRVIAVELDPPVDDDSAGFWEARVSQLHTLAAGEAAGYDGAYTAHRPTVLATLSIGYADGWPRTLSNGAGRVLLHGRTAPIVGLICMDQLLVDVTDMEGVAPGDTATLIGRDGDAVLTAEEAAQAAGTITNELLSRLGPRLERVVLP